MPLREYRTQIPNRHLSLSTIGELSPIPSLFGKSVESLAERTLEMEENAGPETSEMKALQRQGWNIERAIGSWQLMCGAFWAGVFGFCLVIFLLVGLPLIRFLNDSG